MSPKKAKLRHLKKANLRKGNLRKAKLRKGNLRKANLRRTKSNPSNNDLKYYVQMISGRRQETAAFSMFGIDTSCPFSFCGDSRAEDGIFEKRRMTFLSILHIDIETCVM
ncbi:MAG: pentapeptide repeat-containing protein [Parasporobacterium sp.]|nr:pentapeptide repeat-containing protein [Parasporobacterium sp.]